MDVYEETGETAGREVRIRRLRRLLADSGWRLELMDESFVLIDDSGNRTLTKDGREVRTLEEAEQEVDLMSVCYILDGTAPTAPADAEFIGEDEVHDLDAVERARRRGEGGAS